MSTLKMIGRYERLIISQTLVALAKDLHTNIYGPGANFGASVDGIFIAACVSIGHAEKRPMTATNIADYLEMPRPTVLRKLAELEDLDVVTRWGKSKAFVLSDRWASTNNHVSLMVRHLRTAMSKMDGPKV